MRILASLLIMLAVLVASASSAGVSPMGGAAHHQAMLDAPHSGHDHSGAEEAPACPQSIIDCSGIGLTTSADRAMVRAAVDGETRRAVAKTAFAHEPAPEGPPPKA